MLHLMAAALLAAFTLPLALLDLQRAKVGPGLPPSWEVREVRGQRSPDVDVVPGDDGLALRLRGTGRAAWLYRQLGTELNAGGTLHWSWRVTVAPASADLRQERLDDSAIRVFVVFGHPRLIRSPARIIFYSFGNGEPTEYARASFGSSKLHVIRVDGAADRMRWREHRVDPFGDYKRIWGDDARPISAVGVMQDTDQTKEAASAEIRRMEWITAVEP